MEDDGVGVKRTLSVREVEYSLTHGAVCGQLWEAKGASRPGALIVALHGWLDNSESFAYLAPLLAQHCRVLALDLPGHGKSDHLLPGANYYVWEPLAVLHELLGQLQVSKGAASVHLLGHSMGGSVASLYASLYPQEITSLMLLDSLGPMTTEPKDWLAQLALGVRQAQVPARPVRHYASLEDALSSRQRATPMISAQALRPMVARNLSVHGAGYCWRTDPRLKHASKVKLSEAHVEAMLREISIPVQVLLARQGIIPSQWRRQRLDCVAQLDYAMLEGHHHFHMEWSTVTEIAQRVLTFIDGVD